MSKDHRVCAKCGLLLECSNLGVSMNSEEICSDNRVTEEHISQYEVCYCLEEKKKDE